MICFADLPAEKVTIQQKSLTMRGLLIEAARQVERIVLLEADDPAQEKKYYDCEVEFESVVSAYLNYYKNKYGVELKRSDRRDVLILGLSDEDRETLSKKREAAAAVELEKNRKNRKSLWQRMMDLDKEEKPQPKPSIKKMIYPEVKSTGVERKSDSRMKIEILPPSSTTSPKTKKTSP